MEAIVAGVFALILIFWLILIYNKLVAAKQLVENGWSDISVQLKRRADVIPQIVSTVKAYAAHETQLFEDIIAKRHQALAAGGDTRSRAEAENALGGQVTRLFALAEDYPDLKANENFLDLQNELSETENKIEMARRFYNGAVRQLNVLVQSFPNNLFAQLFGFKVAEFFNIDTIDKTIPATKF